MHMALPLLLRVSKGKKGSNDVIPVWHQETESDTLAVQARVEGLELSVCQAVSGVDEIAGVSCFHSYRLGASCCWLNAHNLLSIHSSCQGLACRVHHFNEGPSLIFEEGLAK